MRAAKWKLDDGKKRIQGTIQWRREYKPDLIPPEEVRIESETGKIVLNGFDIDGRPIITMRPGKENTSPSPRQIRHLIFYLERAIDFMPPGQDTLVIVVDYNSATVRTNPSISTASKVLTILQNHYVERLGRAIVVNLPFILNFFYKGISPFLDPVTREKMRFNPNLPELIPVEQLGTEFGGTFNYVFEPVSYWDQLLTHARIAPDGTRLPSLKPEQPQETPGTPSSEDASSAVDSGRTTPEMVSGSSSIATHGGLATPAIESAFPTPLTVPSEKGQ